MPLKKGRVEERQDPTTRDLELWVEELSHEDPSLRRAAAVALESQPTGAEAVVERLREEENSEVLASLINTALTHGTEEMGEVLLELIRVDDAARRTLAVDALRTLPSDRAHFLVERIADEDPDVRILVVNTLQQVASEEVEAVLVEHLGQESHPNVVAAIVEALLEVGSASSVEALRAAKDRFADEAFLTFAIDAAAGELERRGEA